MTIIIKGLFTNTMLERLVFQMPQFWLYSLQILKRPTYFSFSWKRKKIEKSALYKKSLEWVWADTFK